MPYQDSSYQDSNYQDSSYPPGGGGGGTPPPSEPYYLSAVPFLWNAVLDDLQVFFDELGGPIHEHGNDQNSYYDDPADSAPMGELFLQDFQWIAHVGGEPAHNFDYLTSDLDPELLMIVNGSGNFSGHFSRGDVAIQALSDGTTFGMTFNGITVFGTWHAGAPTTTDGDVIVVTGGHWTFQYTGFDIGHYNDNPPPAPPPQVSAPSADAAAALADPEGIATAHIQDLSNRLHAFLAQNGGHFTVTFQGPNGQESFELADLLNRLDHYHINPSDTDFTHITGGAGGVHSDGHGGWVTDFNRAQLVSYETMAFHQLEFIILHEVSHVLTNGLDFTHNQRQSWFASGGNEDTFHGNGIIASPNFWYSESYANNMAVALEHLIDIREPPHPAGGLDYAGVHG